MLVCAAGDCHGKLSALYDGVQRLECEVGQEVDLVLQVGDLGVWPDPKCLDVATRAHGGAGEFQDWYLAARPVPRKTIFIAGNHEDFRFLQTHPGQELLPGLTFLPWGETIEIAGETRSLKIGGIGGCFSPSFFDRPQLAGRRRRHYLKRELVQLEHKAAGVLDVLLLHDAPAGRVIAMNNLNHRPRGGTSESQGLAELISAIQPSICLTGHLHIRSERLVAGVLTVGLNMVPHRGSLLLLDFPLERGEPRQLAELGGRLTEPRSPDVALHPPDPSVAELQRVLEEWAIRFRGPDNPSREERKEFHREFSGHPWFDLLMPAFRGAELPSTILDIVPAAERTELLESFRDRGVLP
jgi:hypothetical protein